MENQTKKFNPKYILYRAHPSDLSKGSAIFWEYSPKAGKIFIGAAKQKTLASSNVDNATFDWQNTKQMSIDVVDIGAILAFINKDVLMSNGKGLFHQNAKGNTVFNLNKYEKDPTRYILSLSFKIENEITKFSQMLSTAELMIIQQFLIKYLHLMFEN